MEPALRKRVENRYGDLEGFMLVSGPECSASLAS